MYSVYILKSKKNGRYYIGQTDNLVKRFNEHNLGKSKSTKSYRPWEIIHKEDFFSRREAIKRERKLKNYKKRIRLEKLFK